MTKGTSKGERTRKSGATWASALLWLLLFCVAGFAIGVGLGLFVENPELIVRHGRGESEEISWAIDAVPEAEGSAAPNFMAEKLVSEAPDRTTPGSARNLPGTRAASLEGPGFLVQVGAYAAQASAQNKVESLREQGFKAWVAPSAIAGTKSWRVRLGPLRSRAEAQELARKLEDKGLSTWVLANDGEAGS